MLRQLRFFKKPNNCHVMYKKEKDVEENQGPGDGGETLNINELEADNAEQERST